MNTINNDIIKTFLKINEKNQSKNSLYSIDSSKNIFTLYSQDKNKQDFELDKIFTNTDENSYIYEIICLNTIKECIKGTSYSFISFGETINKKLEFLIGDLVNNYKNINYYGIFIRFLENLLLKKNEKEFDFSIKFSNFLIYENNLVDLTYFGNKKKEEYGIDTNLFLSNAFKIKNDLNIINNTNKININNINEIIKYLRYILEFLYKLEKNVYSKSNICFIIYLINEPLNKKVSTASFISLCGSEHLYAEDIQNVINKNNINEKEKKGMEATKSSIETRFTFDSIINCVENNNYIKHKIEEKKYFTEMYKDKIQIEDKKILSKLTTVLYDICFDNNNTNIKYRFIGNIRPIEGYYKNVRDVLLFLFDCSKIMKKMINSKRNSQIAQSPRDEEIFNLEYKIKIQSKTINDLNNNLDRQNKKILLLENTYKEQINAIKKYFNFRGDINILLSGDENTKEMKYVEKIKNHNFLVIKYESTIDNLEKKLAIAEDEIKKLKNKLSSKELDQTMINYYLSVKDSQDKKLNHSNTEILKELYNKIDKLNKEINNKNKIIEELKKDLDKKNEIFCKFSKTLSGQMEGWTQVNSKEISKKNEIKNKNKKNDLNDLNESELSDITLRQELVKMKIKNQKALEELKEKYKFILLEKKNTIYDLEHKFEKIDEVYKYEFKKINSELTKMHGMLISLISYIENNKKNIIIEKNSTELEKIIFSIKEDININNYPFLFKEIENQKKLKENNEENKEDENSMRSEKNEEEKKEKNIKKDEDLSKDELIEKLKNKIKRLTLNFDIQLKKYNNNIFLMGLQQRTIEKLKREINIYKQTFKNKNITPPIISLNTNMNNNEIKNENKKNKQENKVIQKSFSFTNNDKGVFKIPLLKYPKSKLKESDIYNFDSIIAPSTNNTNNINSFFRPSSPDSSYSNTNSNNNINNSFLYKNNINNINKTLLNQKKGVNENKNRRPFSAIRQRDNFNFNKRSSKTKY